MNFSPIGHGTARRWYVEWTYCCTFDNAGKKFTLAEALRFISKNAKRIERGTTGSTEKLQSICITLRP